VRKTRGKAGCLEVVYTPEEEAAYKKRRIREAMLPALADLILAMDEDPSQASGGGKLKAAAPAGESNKDSLKHRVRVLRERLKTFEP
jgi:hypothetical protein